MRLNDYPTLVTLWTQEGCEHCETTLPAWRKVAAKYASCLPSARMEVTRWEREANHYRIKLLPTLMTLRWGRSGLRRLEGALTLAEIEAFYVGSMMGLDCQLG
jgi:thioredoxin-like negative regulator of GroEL